MAEVDRSVVGSILEGMPLPARRDEIVEHAEVEGADDELLAALRALPDREYESTDEVGEALRPIEPNPGAADRER
jgi:Protein of unknown function (DUF2795)